MENKNKIIRYFDNQMPDDEKLLFEQEIRNSPELQKEMDDYKSLIFAVKETKDIELKDDYLVNIVPNFREKLGRKSKSKSFSVKFALAGSTAAAVIIAVLLLFNTPNKSNIENIQQLASQMTPDEVASAASNYINNVSLSDININSSGVYDSIFTKILGNELSISSNLNLDQISSNNSNLLQFEQYINDKEADNIYNEILNKKF